MLVFMDMLDAFKEQKMREELKPQEKKLQNFGHLMQRADSFEETLMFGKIEGRRRRGDRG